MVVRVDSGAPTSDDLRCDLLALRGRVGLVTGVSRRAGIGYAGIVRRFLDERIRS